MEQSKMYPIPEGLSPTSNNKSSSYIPVRNKGNDFAWDIITGLVLSHALRKQIKQYEFEQFRSDCKSLLQSKLIDFPSFWDVINRVYFTTESICKISPLFLLFKVQRKGESKASLGAANVRMSDLFSNLMGGLVLKDELVEKHNFIEHEILTIFSSKLEDFHAADSLDQAYLPYLSDAFQTDLSFLAIRPQYLLQELTNLLKLYAFAYCSQLSLNIKDWKNKKAVSKPLYFILDTEKASSERTQLQRYGYRLLADTFVQVFPILSALENLQQGEHKRPLWQVYQDVIACSEQDKLLTDINAYLKKFIEDRIGATRLEQHQEATSTSEAFEQMMDLAIEQFQVETSTRDEINGKYAKALKELCSDFIQSRGRSGRVLVLNQDQLMLLTNISIGNKDKLLMNDLMREFERRGFYLDKQSQQALVDFYERMGNVARMSDSGDAVYVRKTV
jgi:DNA phosphorothioation-dependent restriction protein DptG